MKYVKINWVSRTLIIVGISIIISLLMVSLELTDWAAQMNLQTEVHGKGEGDKRNMPTALMYILPFVKELILIGVPMLLTLLILTLSKRLKGVICNRKITIK